MKPHQTIWRACGAYLTAILLLPAIYGRSQVLTPDIPFNRSLAQAEEQYNQGHYRVAAQSARQYLEAKDNLVEYRKPGDIEKAKYFLAVSMIKDGSPGCVDEGTRFLQEKGNPAYSQRVNFAMAQYYFHTGEYEKAIPYYEVIVVSNLDNAEIADEKFELAYCYFNNREFNKSAPLLLTIKEIRDGKYYKAANYYYGLIVYNENKYPEALGCFEKIKDAKDYRTVVPYYIAEIYYFMGEREKALQQADTLIKRTEKSYYDNELHLLAAQCLFEDQRYEEAVPYFEFYYDHSEKIRKEDLYEMAYSYYKTSAWTNAIEKFKMLSDARDSLGQTSMYLLGDCYLNTSDIKSARNAFGICADMTFNEGQQEAAMILYAKTSYETGFNDDALRELNTLLKTFPRTHYKDEANTLISDLLLKTNNFQEALAHLADVKNKDNQFKSVYQKANFGYAVIKFREGGQDSAFQYFTQSLTYPDQPDYEAAAWFWKGELAYHMHHYNEVIDYTRNFITKRGTRKTVVKVSPMATLQHAYLNLGYAAMELQDYAGAQNYFSQAQASEDKDPFSGSVAAVKEADAVFMQKNYSRAIVLYEKIIATDTVNADYARYQKSILLGLEGKNDEKIAVLNSLVQAVPPSAYLNYARYEIAVTYIETDKYQSALPYLRQLTDSAGDKSFAPKSWMKIGFIYQQLNDYNLAIEAYKHVIIEYPSSEDRLPAMDALRSLYIQSNQPSAYTQMLKDNSLPSADSGSIDSTYYAAAEAQFGAGKMEEAREAFTNYLQQYPKGFFVTRAHYYRGEANYQLKKYDEAKQDYDLTLHGGWNEFEENSALRAGDIAYNEKDYPGAYSDYLKLISVSTSSGTRERALDGLVKSAYHCGKSTETRQYADTLLCTPGASEGSTEQAMYYKAKALQDIDSADAASRIYKQIANNNTDETAAEARYQLSAILYGKGMLKDAETAANQTIHLSAGYDYWIVKSYIMLADILAKEKDYFNAKATLESIVKHTNIPELKDEAAAKLTELKKAEKQKSKLE